MLRTIATPAFALGLLFSLGEPQGLASPPAKKLDVKVTLYLPGKTPFKEWKKTLDRLEALGVKETFLGQPVEGKAGSAKVTAGPEVPAKELGGVVTALLESGIRVISLEAAK